MPHSAFRTPPSAERSVLTRLQWLAALGVIELLAVSFWLDTDRVATTGFWRLVLKKLPDGILFGLVAVGLALLLGGFAAWTKLREEVRRRRLVTSFPWHWYGLHISALIGFLLTGRLLVAQEASAAGAADPRWVTAWFAWGLATGITWLAALLPASLWRMAAARIVWAFVAAVPLTVAAWAIARTARHSWHSYSEPTLNAVLFVLRLFGEQPVHDPSTMIVSLGDFSIEIYPDCSGYQGFGVMAAFSTVYVWAFRRQLRFPQACLLVPLALVAALIGNVVRIAVLIEIGARLSPEVALGGFHSQGGWLFLILVAGLLVGVAQRTTWFCRDRARGLDLRQSAAAACLTPFLLWHMIGLVSRLMTADPAFDPLYPARWAVLAIPLWYWRKLYARMLAGDGARSVSPLKERGFRGLTVPARMGARGSSALAGGLGLLTGAAAFALWMLLESWIPAAPSEAAHSSLRALDSALPVSLWLVSRAIGHCLAAPFVEELAFRSYLMRRLQGFRFDEVPFSQTGWPGVVISSLVFGALHGERWLAGTLVGLIYALTVRTTGRLSAGVAAHVMTNVLLTGYVLLTGDYDRWH